MTKKNSAEFDRYAAMAKSGKSRGSSGNDNSSRAGGSKSSASFASSSVSASQSQNDGHSRESYEKRTDHRDDRHEDRRRTERNGAGHYFRGAPPHEFHRQAPGQFAPEHFFPGAQQGPFAVGRGPVLARGPLGAAPYLGRAVPHPQPALTAEQIAALARNNTEVLKQAQQLAEASKAAEGEKAAHSTAASASTAPPVERIVEGASFATANQQNPFASQQPPRYDQMRQRPPSIGTIKADGRFEPAPGYNGPAPQGFGLNGK